MKKNHGIYIRTLLKKHPMGLTANEIHENLPFISNAKSVRRTLSYMPDVYIDRWANAKRGQYQAVYCLVEKPQDCPHPTSRYDQPKTRWVNPFATTMPNT